MNRPLDTDRASRRRSSMPGGLVPPALLALALVSCSDRAPLEEWTLELQPDLVLGAQPAGEATAFFEPTDLHFDGRGRIHILDGGNARVQVFAPDGTYLRTLGRAGEGPGDLMRPEGMWVFADGEVVVADTGNRRLQRYGPAGDPLPPMGLDYLPLDVVGTADSLWVLRLPPPTFVLGPDPEPLVQRLDRDGSPVAGYVQPATADVGILYFLANVLRIAEAPGGGFAVADTHVHSRIRRHDREGLLEAEIPVLYKADVWAPLGRMPEHISEESLSAVARTASDLTWDGRRGLYWVLSGYVDRSAEGAWTVGRELYRYGADGAYRGSVMLPFAARRVSLAPDGAVWLLDTEGAARRMILSDPETVEAGPG